MNSFNIKSRPIRALFEAAALICAIGLATAVGVIFRSVGFPETNTVIVYLLAVLVMAVISGNYIFGIAASIAATFAFNFFFTEPLYSFAVYDPSYIITFAIMITTSIITTALTGRVKNSEMNARKSEEKAKALYMLTNNLTEAGSIDDMAKISTSIVSAVMQCDAAILFLDENEKPYAEYTVHSHDGSFYNIKANDTSYIVNRIKGHSLRYYAGKKYYDWPIYGREAVLGIFRIPASCAQRLTESGENMMTAMTESTAMAIDRFRAAQERIKYRECSEQEHYRSNLLRSISHDLRTPLSGIMGTSEMIMDMSAANDPRKKLAAQITKDADWLKDMVENILNLTRLQEGRLQIKKQPEAVEEIVGSALAHIERRAPEYDIKVNVPLELLVVPMDARLIEQVLVNLIDNAMKHTPKEKEIAVSVFKQCGFVVFKVTDHGEGILEEDMPNIFEVFYTSGNKKAAADSKHGVGLGLPICDAIVKAHKGTISARNIEQGGAEFTFTLPLEDNADE